MYLTFSIPRFPLKISEMPPGGQWLMSVLRFYIVFAQQERLVEYCAYTLTYCSLCLCLDGWRLAVPLMSTSDSF